MTYLINHLSVSSVAHSAITAAAVCGVRKVAAQLYQVVFGHKSDLEYRQMQIATFKSFDITVNSPALVCFWP